MKIRSSRLLAAAAAVAALVAAPSAAMALPTPKPHPAKHTPKLGKNDTYTLCINKRNGKVRIPNKWQGCYRHLEEKVTLLSAAAVGKLVGPQGPKGDKGDPGPNWKGFILQVPGVGKADCSVVAGAGAADKPVLNCTYKAVPKPTPSQTAQQQ
jgi:hypothetical protein